MLWEGYNIQLDGSLKELKVKGRVKVSQVKKFEKCAEVQSGLELYNMKVGRSQNG